MSASDQLDSIVDLAIRDDQEVSSDSTETCDPIKHDTLTGLNTELDRLLHGLPENRLSEQRREFDGYRNLFERFLQEEGTSIDWDCIECLPEDAVCEYDTLETPSFDQIHEMLEKVVVVKLNGGLGTSMGCHGPKSAIAVREDLNFLDLTVQQIDHLNKTYKANVPLVLMNSFSTDEGTQRLMRKCSTLQVQIHTFKQSCYPRISRESLLPIAKNCNIQDDIGAWYPPGHGDFYLCFRDSGLLRKFVQEGKQYCFISNIDNLGATLDARILNLLINPKNHKQPEFIMEVTDKTRADVKGGTLVSYENKPRLLEIAQVPQKHVEVFKSIKTFNTNNLWVKLDAVERILQQNRLNLEIIVNNKTLPNGETVIQLETAVGAAMKTFENAIGIRVPRSRFLPVKKTSDLLLVMSNFYHLKNGSLVISPLRKIPNTPLINLSSHFTKVQDFLARFASIPDLLELEELTVCGDVTFGKGVSLKGIVIIAAPYGSHVDIVSGAMLEGKFVSGNLSIQDIY